ncbi:TetR/AcrR family transcriptional regulator [Methanobrevibacter sp.]
MNNKEKIFLVSIDLFSRYGYDGVSIRQIAGNVGIKESSIYNHYKSKESILDAILDYYIGKMTENEIPLSKASENLDVGLEYFYKAGLDLYIAKLREEKMMEITRFILIEAYHNEKIRNFLKCDMIEGPVNGWIQLFDLMKQKNLIVKDCNSKELAESFFYYSLFLLIEHFIIRYPEDDEKFLNDLAIKSERQMKLIYNSVKVVE